MGVGRAVVTGGGSGIGLATARRLAGDGAAVAAVDIRFDEDAARFPVLAIPGDVGDETSIAEAVNRAASQLGGLDAVVACAGVVHAQATHELRLDDWERLLRVNLTGTFLAVKHALPHLLAAGGGSIVTIGSIASVVAGGYAASYDASKSGVLGFTRAVAVEYADRGIRANCVCPGHVATELKAHSAESTGLGGSVAGRVAVPMPRRADPGEVANVIAFLCSDESSFMTGATLMVDGGFTAV
jgi:NAD(P)-dependent dehydrogenase (short-subunit alcohol dehydrogenase family)